MSDVNIPKQKSAPPVGSVVHMKEDEEVKEPQGRCVYCTYELEPQSRMDTVGVSMATVVKETPNGPRDLCAAHAAPGNIPKSVKFKRR